MLLLTRKPGEEIIIGDDIITVTLIKIGRGQIKIGIAAPDDMLIWCSELELLTGKRKKASKAWPKHPRRSKKGGVELTSKLGEDILIGEDITVALIKIGRGQVKIGINAPNDIPIRRSELEPFTRERKTTVKPKRPRRNKRGFVEMTKYILTHKQKKWLETSMH